SEPVGDNAKVVCSAAGTWNVRSTLPVPASNDVNVKPADVIEPTTHVGPDWAHATALEVGLAFSGNNDSGSPPSNVTRMRLATPTGMKYIHRRSDPIAACRTP